jgi:hypothetical protein
MKKIVFIWFLLAFAGCKDDNSEQIPADPQHCVSKEVVNTLSRVEGSIERFENIYLIQTSQQRYYACNLPEDYKSVGKKIIFDAREYRIPPNVKVLGIPIIITKVY